MNKILKLKCRELKEAWHGWINEKKSRIIRDVEFEDENSLDFNIRQKGKDTVDQQDLIAILDGIRNKLTESEIVDEDGEKDDEYDAGGNDEGGNGE